MYQLHLKPQLHLNLLIYGSHSVASALGLFRSGLDYANSLLFGSSSTRRASTCQSCNAAVFSFSTHIHRTS